MSTIAKAIKGGRRQPVSHEWLEHTGEVRLRVRAGSFEELVEEAGRALAALELRGPLPHATGDWEEIDLHAPDSGALLVDWLNELIFRAEANRWVALEFEVRRATPTHLRARARGTTTADPPAFVKAATLHNVRVEPVAGGLEAHVVLDI